MRKFSLSIENYPGCCRAEIIYGFENYGARKKITDEEWLYALSANDYFDNELYSNIITFTHSSRENRGALTPKKFSEWLISRGEKIAFLEHEHITIYICVLSDKFMEDYRKYKRELDGSDDDGDTDD